MLHLAVLHSRKLCVYSVSGKRTLFSRGSYVTRWVFGGRVDGISGAKTKCSCKGFLVSVSLPASHYSCLYISWSIILMHSCFYQKVSYNLPFVRNFVHNCLWLTAGCSGSSGPLKLKWCPAMPSHANRWLAVESEVWSVCSLFSLMCFSFSSHFLGFLSSLNQTSRHLSLRWNWVLFLDVVLRVQV